MYTKNTKIVCTLGPSSDSTTEITALIKAGMNVARLNFSHGSYEQHQRIIDNVRKAEKQTGKTIGILQDLQGPKIRLGDLPPEGIQLKRSDKVLLTTKNLKTKSSRIIIPVEYKKITQDVSKGDIILINDGLVELKATKVDATAGTVEATVTFGGLVKKKNGLNLPTSTISAATITPKDKADLAFGLKNDVDFIALSFVKDAKDINDLRKMIKKAGKTTKIIAKVERHEAVANLEEIVEAADGLMVARGDLGSDLPPEKVPLVQKRMIALANKAGKPIITATQVLQSMIESARATRAEISDAANAVFDHTDAIMLSNESAVGKYPAKAAATLTKVASTIEKELRKHPHHIAYHPEIYPASSNAYELALDCKASHIVVYTKDGTEARHLVNHRPYIPVVTITPNYQTARELTLSWAINDVFVKKLPKKDLAAEIEKFLKTEKIVKKGDQVIIVYTPAAKESIISSIKI